MLGVCISYWLSTQSKCSIALVDKEDDIAVHTSSRNTGVIHRPFYLNPVKKGVFARASQKSYFLWRDLAKTYSLPWTQVGTLEVASDEGQLATLEEYRNWSLLNGMDEAEVEVLEGKDVRRLEPEVQCPGAIYSKTDTAVDFRALTTCVFTFATKSGASFLGGSQVFRIRESADGIQLKVMDSSQTTRIINCKFMINAAGGGAIDIAHAMSTGRQYTDLHFRGEYWIVDDEFGTRIRRNIYSVARHKEFPFLDPHFVVRANGRREVGPNAVLVADPFAYSGLSSKRRELIRKLFENPNSPKIRLFTNPEFLSLVWQEWRSSISKNDMCGRVRHFIPSLKTTYLREKGLAGVRSSVINDQGFVPEAIVEESNRSLHILNYNSPGATGAPAFSAFLVRKIFEEGHVQKNREENPPISNWNFESASNLS